MPTILLGEAAAPATPAANTVAIYAKSDGKIYSKDDTGVEILMSLGAGSGVTLDSISNAIADGTSSHSDNAITWNWVLTSAGRIATVLCRASAVSNSVDL